MIKPSQKSSLLLAVGMVIVLIVGGVGWVTVKILTRPGPRQIAKAREEAQRKMMTEEQKRIEEMTAEVERLSEELKNMPPFKIPATNVVAPDRQAAWADILETTVKTVRKEQEQVPKGRKTLSEGIVLANRMMLVTNKAQALKLIEHEMTAEEYDWIDKQMMAAEIVALLKLEELETDPKKKEEIHKGAQFLSVSIGVYSSVNDVITGQPERVDPATVPPENYRFVLENIQRLGITQMDITKFDWTPLLKKEGVIQ